MREEGSHNQLLQKKGLYFKLQEMQGAIINVEADYRSQKEEPLFYEKGEGSEDDSCYIPDENHKVVR